MEQNLIEVRRAFGLLFVGVSISVGTASILSEVVFEQNDPTYYYAMIWFGSFGVTFGIIFSKWKKIIPSIRGRMKNSVNWPTPIKAINGLCWAVPFATIGVFPSMYQYLILIGIGFGNVSTYLFMKKYSGLVNNEQVIVGGIALVAIPIAVLIDSTFISNQTIAVILSRFMIAVAYGIGGAFALHAKE